MLYSQGQGVTLSELLPIHNAIVNHLFLRAMAVFNLRIALLEAIQRFCEDSSLLSTPTDQNVIIQNPTITSRSQSCVAVVLVRDASPFGVIVLHR